MLWFSSAIQHGCTAQYLWYGGRLIIMDKKVGKKLRSHFEEQLLKRLPQFQPISDPNVPPGSRAFEWKMKENLCAYIVLLISPKRTTRDNFTIDVAWSIKCRFPSPRPIMSPFPIARSRTEADPPQDGEYYTRIGSLVEPYRDYWWTVTNREEEKKTLDDDEYFTKWILNSPPITDYVEERVKDAIDRIIRDAIPYLENVAIDESSRLVN
jgi:hypothetical protein